jgi:hypothetical protein
MINLQAFQVSDFSGGITDKFIDAPPSASQKCDNLEITVNRKLLSRPGSRLYDSTYSKPLSAETSRVSKLIGYDNDTDLLAVVNKRLFQYKTTGWNELLGPASSPAFNLGDASSIVSSAQGLKHVILSNDSYNPIIKVYRDSSSNLQLRTAGLPELASTPTITPSGGAPKTFTVTIASPAVFTCTSHGLSAGQRIKFTTTGSLPTGISTNTTYFVKTVVDANTFKISATLDGTEINTSGTQSGTHSLTAYPNSYLYAFVMKYDYNAEDKQFTDYGPTTQTTSITYASEPSSSYPTAITVIPTLANSSGSHYDTSNIKIEIYRTINAGSVFYKVGSVTNGTTSFNDTVSDSSLMNNEVLYTTGDVLDNDPPPASKVVHISAGNVAFYGNLKEGTEILPNRIRQSVANDFDSCPADFWVDLNTEVVGLSSVKGTLIALTKKGIYRVDGIFDETGNGGMVAQVIDDTVDCVSHDSIIQVLDGIVWCASDGVYLSDGYKVQKISQELDETYSQFIANRPSRIQGTYNSTVQRVYWCVQESSVSADNDKLLVLDLRWGIRPHSTFTTWSGGTSFSPSSALVYNKKLIRGDSRGYVFKHDTSYLNDLTVDIYTSVSSWITQPIVYDYISTASSLGTITQRKWVPKVTTVFDAITNLSVQLTGINDSRKKVKELAPIVFRGRFVWGDPTVVWGDQTITWNFEGNLHEVRRFPAGGLRTSYKQIEITNAYSNIYKSDTYGPATVDEYASTVTLDNFSATNKWPSDITNFYITFESDGYTKDYPILTRTDDVLTFQDISAAVTGGSQKWLIRGYPKDEILSLQSYALYFATFSESITDYQGVVGGNE